MAPRKGKKGGKKAAKKSPMKKPPMKKSSMKKAAKKATRKSSKKVVYRGKTVAKPKFGGKKFDCRGKRVKSGKSSGEVPRVFCSRMKPKK